MAKFVTAAEAVQQIKDGSMLATSGFVGGLLAEAVLKEIQASFKANGTPKDLSIVYAAGQGDSGERGLNHLGERFDETHYRRSFQLVPASRRIDQQQ